MIEVKSQAVLSTPTESDFRYVFKNGSRAKNVA
jgi:hypothetical protein